MKGLSAMLAGALVTLSVLGAPAYGQGNEPATGGAVGVEGRVLWTHETGG